MELSYKDMSKHYITFKNNPKTYDEIYEQNKSMVNIEYSLHNQQKILQIGLDVILSNAPVGLLTMPDYYVWLFNKNEYKNNEKSNKCKYKCLQLTHFIIHYYKQNKIIITDNMNRVIGHLLYFSGDYQLAYDHLDQAINNGDESALELMINYKEKQKDYLGANHYLLMEKNLLLLDISKSLIIIN